MSRRTWEGRAGRWTRDGPALYCAGASLAQDNWQIHKTGVGGSMRRMGDATTGACSLLAILGDTGHILISAERNTLLLLTVLHGGVLYLLPHSVGEEGH